MTDKTVDTLIIGAGLSGLSTAYFLKKKYPQKEILLLEASKRSGGTIRTFKSNGYIAEYGAHGFLDNVAESRELLEIPALKEKICKASLKTFLRYVCLNGQLEPIPQNPVKILSSPILPLRGKLRILADLFHPPKLKEQSVAEWGKRRFGKHILPLLDCVFTGTYGGDIHKLSIDAVMPGVRRLEQQSGSVIKGVLGKAFKGKKKARRMPSMINFKGGMEDLMDALKDGLNILYQTPVTKIQKDVYGWLIKTDKKTFLAKNLVIATGINPALPLLTPLQLPPAPSVPEAKIANIVLGFNQSVNVPHGFGYLAPQKEKRFALGAMFSSHMFSGRTPHQNVLLEGLVGGRYHPERIEMDDSTLIEATLKDLKELMILPGNPLYAKVLRSNSGIPQLEIGHSRFLTYRKNLESQYNDLKITGFGWDAIGMNDMIKSAHRIADEWGHQTPQSEEKPVKPIYF